QLLLRSIPTLEAKRGVALDVIEGTVPEPGGWPAGCRFAPRCPYVRDACRAQAPDLRTLGAGRAAACIRVGEIAR
ncbi:MAG: peptide ABC transporter ATP-binding protein, partial [Alphaproteobacteria bacterium]|nr:peptide ABC transporter ATP-binding protein [Alphaproteobacteria bacterium]